MSYVDQIIAAGTARDDVEELVWNDISDGAVEAEGLSDLILRVNIIIAAVKTNEIVSSAKMAEMEAAAHAQGHATAVVHGDA